MRRCKAIFFLSWMVFMGLPAGAQEYHLKVGSVAAHQYEKAVTTDESRSELTLDIERTAALRKDRQYRTFVYKAKKAEKVSIKVWSVQFLPEVFLRDLNGNVLKEELNRDGKREVVVRYTFSNDGDCNIRIRAKGAGQGLFHVVVRLDQDGEQGVEVESGPSNSMGTNGR